MRFPALERLREERSQLVTEARSLTTSGDLEGDDVTRFESIEGQISELDSKIAEYEDLHRRIESGKGIGFESGDGAGPIGAPQFMHRGDPFELSSAATEGELRSQAKTAIERWETPDEFKQTANAIVEHPDYQKGVAAHVIRFSHPDYVSAFRAQMEDPFGFGDLLTTGQKRALQMGRLEARATLQISGTVLPSPLDPTIVLSNTGHEGSIRDIANVRQTIANTYRTINSAGVTASYDAEATEVSDDTPSLTGTTITTRKAQAMVVATLEAAADQPDFADEVANMFGDAKFRLDELKFVKGVAGSNEPIGIETAIDGGSYELAPATAETFAAGDVYTTLEGLAPRWRNASTWVMELSTANKIRRFYNPSGTEPPLFNADGTRLLGLPFVLHSSVDAYSDIDAAATEDNFILFVGDFKRGYTIADRIGMAVVGPQLLQNTTAGRFDGTLGFYAYWRTGADITADGAIVALSIPTAA